MSRRGGFRKRGNRMSRVRGTANSKADKRIAQGKPISLNRIKSIQQDTTRFLDSKYYSNKVRGPELSNPFIGRRLRSILANEGVTIQSLDKGGLVTPFIRIRQEEISPKILADNGIVPGIHDPKSDNPYSETELSWIISGYDLLHLIMNGEIGKYTSTEELYSELYDYFKSQNSDFPEKFRVYEELHAQNLHVFSGLSYGYDFIIYEEPDEEFMEIINELDPADIGRGGIIRTHGIGAVDVIQGGPDHTEYSEIFKGQHLASKNDMRYFIAYVESDNRDELGSLISDEGPVKFFNLRLNRKNESMYGDKAMLLKNADIEMEAVEGLR